MLDEISLERINSLHPKIKEDVLDTFTKAQALIGTDTLRVVQGLRTFAEQQAIYDQGRINKNQPIVSDAEPGSSYHNYGLAIDLCMIVNGKVVWDLSTSIINLFKSRGYQWGGDFRTFKDRPHFEKSFGLSVKDLLKKYEVKDFINVDGINYVNI